jgi:hypothetical protein
VTGVSDQAISTLRVSNDVDVDVDVDVEKTGISRTRTRTMTNCNAGTPDLNWAWLSRAPTDLGDPRTFSTSCGLARPLRTRAIAYRPIGPSDLPTKAPERAGPPYQGPEGRQVVARVRKGRATCRCSRISPALPRLFEPCQKMPVLQLLDSKDRIKI